MKDFFRTRGFKMLIVAVIVLLGAIGYTASIGGFSSITSSIIGLFSTPMQDLAGEGGDKVQDVIDQNDPRTLQELRDQIAELEKQVAEKNTQLVDYYSIKKENEQLKKYLDLKDLNPDWEFVSASVVGRDPNEEFYGFTINKGTLAGVQAGDPVITESGLVGRVIKVGATYAKVATIFSPEVRVAAISAQTGDTGILVGDKKMADQNLVQLTALDPKATVQQGELIVTSGMGGVFPANIVIGTVQSVATGTLDISLTAVLDPASEIQSVKDVFVITSFLGQGETMDSLNDD